MLIYLDKIIYTFLIKLLVMDISSITPPSKVMNRIANYLVSNTIKGSK